MKIWTDHIPTVTVSLGDANDHASWACLCGNTPRLEGFYPCDAEGQIVEPTPETWTTDCYVCDRCGRIINQATREVVGRVRNQR